MKAVDIFWLCLCVVVALVWVEHWKAGRSEIVLVDMDALQSYRPATTAEQDETGARALADMERIQNSITLYPYIRCIWADSESWSDNIRRGENMVSFCRRVTRYRGTHEDAVAEFRRMYEAGKI